MGFAGTQFLTSRLGRRMLAVFGLCALIPVTALALVSYRAARADLEGQARERLHDATKNLGMSMLERFLFVLEELEFAEQRMVRGQPLAAVQEFPDRLVGIAHVDDDELVGRIGDEFSLAGLRPGDRERLARGEPAITFPVADSGAAAAVIWYPMADGSWLAASVEPTYGWGSGLLAVLPSSTDVVVLTPSGQPILSTISAAATRTITVAGGDSRGRHFDASFEGVAYFGGRWALPLRHNFGHPGLVLVSLTERVAALQRAAGFGREYLLLGLTSLWIVLLLSIGQIRRSLTPLDDLTVATDRIARRDFTHRVQVSSDDEFAALANSFNFMSGRLESQFAHLSMIAEIDRSILSSVEMDTVLERSLCALDGSYPELMFAVALFGHEGRRAKVYTAHDGRLDADEVIVSEETERLVAAGGWHVLEPTQQSAYVVALRQRGAASIVAMPIQGGQQYAATMLLVGAPVDEGFDGDDLTQLRQIADQLGVAMANASLVGALDDMKQGALLALARAVDAKSTWTTGHSERVTDLSVRLARYMGVSAGRLEVIQRGGLLHDIGKIGVPNAVLDKPGKLTDQEYEAMKAHPVIGARILEPIKAYADVLPIVLQHHERMDGKGYPHGIGPDEFDPDARIVAVADVFDACSSDRPYRDGMPLERVMGIIREGAGSHFDPQVVEALEGLVEEQADFFGRLYRAA